MRCKTCKYFNTFGTDNFHGICDIGGLTDQENTCTKYTEEECREIGKEKLTGKSNINTKIRYKIY